MANNGYYLVLPGFTGFYRVLLGLLCFFMGFKHLQRVSTDKYGLNLVFIWFY